MANRDHGWCYSQAPLLPTVSTAREGVKNIQTAPDSKSGMRPTVSGWSMTLVAFKGEFDLNNFQDGLLSSLFMVGLLIGSPLFSQAIRYVNPFRLVGTGVAIWAVAVGCCGATQGFCTMALCRIFVGFGEAAVLAIGPTYIDDKAPKHLVATWLGILYLAIPGGFALGYVFGAGVEAVFGWRGVFVVEAFLMVPFVIFCFVVRPVALNMGNASLANDSRTGSELGILWKDSKVVFSHPVYDVTLIGNVLHTGVLGVLSYWGAKCAESLFHMNGTDLWIGGAVLIAGVAGILSGGRLLDRLGSTISRALTIGSAADLLCALCLAPAFLFIKNFVLFLFPFIFCFTILFIQMVPVSAISLWSVPLHLRPLSTSINTIVIHLLGDVPSPALCGLLLDLLEDSLDKSESTSYRIAFACSAIFLVLASFIFYIAARIGITAIDYRDTEHTVSVSVAEPETTIENESIPLL